MDKTSLKILFVFVFLILSVSLVSSGNVIVSNGKLNLTNNFTVDVNTLFVDVENNRVGIGTVVPAGLLHVAGSGTGTTVTSNLVARLSSPTTDRDISLQFSDTDTNAAYISMLSGDFHLSPTSATSALVLKKTSGNVGIGTINPGLALDVIGSGNFSGGLNVTQNLIVSSGRVGIGTTGPSQLLHISDTGNTATLRIERTDGVDLLLQAGANNALIGTADDTPMRFKTNAIDRMTIDNNGNVGIGTTAPRSLLQLEANDGVNLTINSTDFTLVAGQDIGSIQFFTSDGSTNAAGLAASIDVRADTTDNDATIIFKTRTGTSDPALERVRISGVGNVGIGTASPDSLLEIEDGNIHIDSATTPTLIIDRGAANFGGKVLFQTAGTNKWFMGLVDSDNAGDGTEFYIGETDGGTNAEFWIETNGNVGIGTTSPGGILHLNKSSGSGNVRLDAEHFATLFINSDSDLAGGRPSDASIRFEIGGSSVGEIGFDDSDSDKLKIFAGGQFAVGSGITIQQDGNVGIGTTSPGSRLEIENTASANDVLLLEDSSGLCEAQPTTTGLTWSCSSDEKLKTNIRDASSVMDFFDNFRIRDYTVRKTGEEATGIIAQEVIKFHPELVTEGDDGYLMVSEPGPWMFVKALQEQQAQLEEQTIYIIELEEGNREQEQTIQIQKIQLENHEKRLSKLETISKISLEANE